MVKAAKEIYRDWETAGLPESGVHRPRKPDIRAWGAMLERYNVQTYGARGDGATDDSAAIMEANDAAAAASATVWFPPGVYLASDLVMTAGWDMDGRARIKYSGGSNGECLRISVNDVVCGRIHIDLDDKEPLTGFYIAGDSNTFDVVRVDNAISNDHPWVVRGIYVTGNNNIIGRSEFNDFVSTGNTNDSSPQALVTSGSAHRNRFAAVHSRRARATVVDNATGANSFGEIHCVESTDNGFYGVGIGSHANVGTIFYDGSNSAAGFRHTATAVIGSIQVTRWAAGAGVVFFGDCLNVTIGEIVVDDRRQGSVPSGMILHSNLAAAGNIRIGAIRGEMYDYIPIYLGLGNGTIEYLSIGTIDLTVRFTADPSASANAFMVLDGCKGISIDDMHVRIIRTNPTWADIFRIKLNTALTYRSFIGRCRVAAFEADGITPAAASIGFYGEGFAQENLDVEEGAFNSAPYLFPYTTPVFQAGYCTAQAAPIDGYWRKGKVLWAESPTSSVVGWVCTASGTPGTWMPLSSGDSAVAKAGDTMTGPLVLPGGTAAAASFNIGISSAPPTTPVNGDVWLGTSSMNVQFAGITYTVVTNVGTQTLSGPKTFSSLSNAVSGKMVFNASTASQARINIAHGVALTSGFVDGDMWTTTAGLFIRINGVTKTVTLT